MIKEYIGYVARDENGRLYLFWGSEQPVLRYSSAWKCNVWNTDWTEGYLIPDDIFPDLQCTDSPKMVCIRCCKEETGIYAYLSEMDITIISFAKPVCRNTDGNITLWPQNDYLIDIPKVLFPELIPNKDVINIKIEYYE